MSTSFVRSRNQILQGILIAALFVLAAVELAQPIQLPNADIGRHIKNGELLLAGATDILHKNYYSFTYPDYPFINHHWFFGILSFLGYRAGGFVFLSIAYVGIMLLAVYFMMRAALLRGNVPLVILMASLMLPLICDRKEIRPEGISYLMFGLYFYLMTLSSLGHIRKGLLFGVLLAAQIIWVNTHIFFFLGPLMAAIFWWEGRARSCSVCVKSFAPLTVALLAVSMINPSGLRGMMTPLNVFEAFGYRLAENQNVFFMMKRFPENPIYIYYVCIALLLLAAIGWALRQNGLKRNAAFAALTIFVILAGIKAVRLMAPAGLFFIPMGCFFVSQILQTLSVRTQDHVRTALLVLSAAVLLIVGMRVYWPNVGLGLAKEVNLSADFYKAMQIQGPVFSNYDIGGYLIFHLAPQQKVFLDNRQEAFPQDFFNKVVIPMQEDDKIWQQKQQEYNFNAIFFYRHDLTPWGQSFLINRISDPLWAPVFVDGWNIIFLKRNAQNDAIIRQFELPKTMFAVKRNQ